MECGVYGPLGPLVVKRVDTVYGREHGDAMIQNQPTMAHIAWVLGIRSGDAMLIIPVQVR